jgi:tetratricopeptide (TPR) repeat protein
MGKPGRNDPCSCGSGLKYKRCCAEKDAAAESARLAANKVRLEEKTAEYRAQLEEFAEFHRAKLSGRLDDEDVLTRDSNAVLDLIEAGQLDQAEATARALLECYPQVHDGYTRLGKVFEARGDRRQAAHWYRQSVQFMRQHADRHDPEFIDAIEQRVRRLDK